MNLPFPLTASGQLYFPKLGRHKVIKLTAGVHRQTWISGAPMFTDVHVSNSSPKHVRKITVGLEKVTIFYAHAAATTSCGPAEHLRVPDRTDREVLAKTCIKMARHDWQGIPPDSHNARSLSLTIPQGLVTVSTGRWRISNSVRGTSVIHEFSLHNCDHLQSLIVCNNLTSQRSLQHTPTKILQGDSLASAISFP